MTEKEFYERQQHIEDIIMARQEQQAPAPITLSEEVAQEQLKTPVEMKKAAFALNKTIGSMQGLQAMANLATVAILTQLQQVKEEKAYKGAEVVNYTTGEIVTVNTWEEFCSYGLGKTRARIDEQLQNLKTFGADALEEMQQMGITSKQFRQLRAATKEDENNVIEVIANVITIAKTDTEAARVDLLDLIDRQAAKHTREQDALKQSQEQAQKQAAQEKADLQAQLDRASRAIKNKEQELLDSRATLAMKIDHINQLQEEKDAKQNLSIDEREANLMAVFDEYANRSTNGAIAKRENELFVGAVGFRQLVNTLRNFYTTEKGEPDIPAHVKLKITNFIREINAVYQCVVEDFNLDDSGIEGYEEAEYTPEAFPTKTYL